LPKAVAAEARIDAGDKVEVSVQDGAIILRPNPPAFSLRELVGKITPRNRHGETDWGTPEGDEPW
jgi:antitoxin MazE